MGVSGVVSERGFKACLPAATPAPVLSLAAVDRIEKAQIDPLDLRAIEGSDGHTLSRHVGWSDAQIRERAQRTHHDVSCFDDARWAQTAVDEAFCENQGQIASWIGGGRRGHLALHAHFEREIGRVFRYGIQRFEAATDAEVILENRPALPRGFTIITAFPT